MFAFRGKDLTWGTLRGVEIFAVQQESIRRVQ